VIFKVPADPASTTSAGDDNPAGANAAGSSAVGDKP